MNWANIQAIFGKVETAIAGTLNGTELTKVILTAVGAGGGFWAVLTAIQGSLNIVITDPTTLANIKNLINLATTKNYIGLAVFAATLAINGYIKYSQGIDITPSIPMIKDINNNLPENTEVKVTPKIV